MICEKQDLHIEVHLNLREKSHVLRVKAESDIPTAVTTGSSDTRPILDLGHDNIDQLAEEMLHVLAAQLRLASNSISPWREAPSRNTGPRLEGLHADIRDSLHHHAGRVHVRRVSGGRILDIAVDCDAIDFGDVAEHDWLAEQA